MENTNEMENTNGIENTNEMENKKFNPFIIKQDLTFDERVFKYISEYNPSVCILTPCYGGLCNTVYVTCLLKTKELFDKYKIPLSIIFCRNDSLITRARNNLVAKAMSDVLTTHLFFIDSDISWNEIDVLKLLLANKPFIGGVYPLKKYNWDKLIPDENNTNIVTSVINNVNESILKNLISNEDIIQSHLLKYNLNYLDNVLNIDNNLAKVRHIATGFMMLQRSVLTKMMFQNPQLKYTDDTGFLNGDENNYSFALFNCKIDYDHYLSEDWVFCDSWRKMEGEIYIDISINLTHTGNVDFRGSFLSSIV